MTPKRNTAAFNKAHKLSCLDATLPHGVRLERDWACACGARFHGFDSHVKRDHKAHKAHKDAQAATSESPAPAAPEYNAVTERLNRIFG